MPTLRTELDDLLDRLAAVEPQPTPIVSLYLNTQADDRGRDRFSRFIQDELIDRVHGFHGHDGIRHALEKDAARIDEYLAASLRPKANGVALFSCASCGLFEAIQFDAPFPRHQLHLGPSPHLYPLALLSDRFPRYAALVADTNSARILVFALNRRVDEVKVENEKTRRSGGSGWSQARFQRHVDEQRLQHVKEVVDTLAEIVRVDNIDHVVVAGDEVVVPRLLERFPPALAAKVVDTLRLDITTPEHEVLQRTLDSIRENVARTEVTLAQQALDGHRAGGLGAAGLPRVTEALERGQVHLLLLTAFATPDGIVGEPAPPKKQAAASVAPAGAAKGTNGNGNGHGNGHGNGNGHHAETDPRTPPTIDETEASVLINLARQTDAEVRFVKDPTLLQHTQGVAALLRYRA